MMRKYSFVLRLEEVDGTDVVLAGKRGARLGEMVRAGLPVPSGFIVSSQAYFTFIRENKLANKINSLLSTAHFERADSLAQISSHIKKLIMRGSMPEKLVNELYFSYKKLGGIFRDPWVVLFFSPTCEEAASSNLREGFVNEVKCKGEANLILKIKEGWASLFEPTQIIYRHERKAEHFRTGMAIVVQKVVKASHSGVIYTIDPVSNDKTKIIIEGRKTGKISSYEVRKKDLEIISKVIEGREKLSKNQVISLAMLGKKLEQHYYFPQEIEWAIEKGEIYIERTKNINGFVKTETKDSLRPSEKLQLLLKGVPASYGIGMGRVRIVANGRRVDKMDAGDVLVTTETNSSYTSLMRKASAIITDHGGRASHCGVVSREFGVPAVSGAGKATQILKDGEIVTVNGVLGEVYKGFAERNCHYPGKNCLRTATKIFADLGQIGIAMKAVLEKADGVEFRNEFMINRVKVHPRKLIEEGNGRAYSQMLGAQIALLCKEFAPRPVIYRISDFKSDEYKEFESGKDFESIEANAVLGYRGSFRHIQNPEVFKLEIEAIKIVKQKVGYRNLWMMVPFCRSVKELIEIKRIIYAEGLHRSPTFKLWMACDVPSNAILIDKFIEAGIDGVSIGLDNLTMLTLGIDQQNHETAHGFDESDPAVLWALERVIKMCHKYNISSSIHAKSVLPEKLLEILVELGISSVSVAPDVVERARENIFGIERRLVEKRHYGKN